MVHLGSLFELAQFFFFFFVRAQILCRSHSLSYQPCYPLGPSSIHSILVPGYTLHCRFINLHPFMLFFLLFPLCSFPHIVFHCWSVVRQNKPIARSALPAFLSLGRRLLVSLVSSGDGKKLNCCQATSQLWRWLASCQLDDWDDGRAKKRPPYSCAGSACSESFGGRPTFLALNGITGEEACDLCALFSPSGFTLQGEDVAKSRNPCQGRPLCTIFTSRWTL